MLQNSAANLSLNLKRDERFQQELGGASARRTFTRNAAGFQQEAEEIGNVRSYEKRPEGLLTAAALNIQQNGSDNTENTRETRTKRRKKTPLSSLLQPWRQDPDPGAASQPTKRGLPNLLSFGRFSSTLILGKEEEALKLLIRPTVPFRFPSRRPETDKFLLRRLFSREI